MIEILCNIPMECGEGPIWVPKTQQLYWTDSLGKSILSYSEVSKSWHEISKSIHASSLVPHHDGGFVYGTQTGFYHFDKNLNTKPIAETFENKPITNINDLIADTKGRVYGGQECYVPDAIYKTGYLYKIDTNSKVSIIEEGLHISNGMGFSPDNTFFYLVDTILRVIYKYDFNISTGTISNKRIFAKLDRNDGLPDGLTVDSEGFVWIARFLGGGLTRFDPDGKMERTIALEVAQPTSLTFGGAHFNNIYITSAALFWKTTLAPKKHNYKQPRGGQLFKIQQDILGLPENLASV